MTETTNSKTILDKNLELTKALARIDSLISDYVELKYKYDRLNNLLQNVSYTDSNGNTIINPFIQEISKIENDV